ncbi:hypothetical protein GKZ68_00160 [Hymenobacter sp. BRD128]|uniref:hypothetical protein n=1 Tax=Hymenobacter sp. BRD128 TaxID=2675878 RepID=UPI0015650265|nr:hypothetical protein [Hymenobacter sp. BRD128]QKG55189.1 hypothetical protein GKZ68_00160 [Hymenobacter sp. BRD128]
MPVCYWLALGAARRPQRTWPPLACRHHRPNPRPGSAGGPLIRALLDTLATSRAHPRLQAEAEVRAFYGPASAPAWTLPADSADISPNATVALALLGRAAEYGLRPADYGHARLRALRDSLAQPASLALPARRARQQAQLEVYLSDAVLTFRRDLDRGRLRAYTPSGRERTALAAPPAALRAALASRTVPAAMLAGQPTNREYRQLQQALARWLAWPSSPIRPGSTRRATSWPPSIWSAGAGKW